MAGLSPRVVDAHGEARECRGVARRSGARAGVLGKRALPGAAWIAAISFSLYLVHKPMYGVVQSQLGEWLEGRGIVAWLVYGVASLLAAAVLYYLVERPGLRLRTRVLSRG